MIMPNRMSLREGIQATDAEALGRASEALHLALLQSTPEIHLFPAWPKDWDAEFLLLARGNFVVRAAMKAGRVTKVEIESKSGAECRLRNPWGDGEVVQSAKASRKLSAEIRYCASQRDQRLAE